MRHSPSDGVDPKLIERELRQRLLSEITVDSVAALISTHMQKRYCQWPCDAIGIRRLAAYLCTNLGLKDKEIEQLIKNRPTELAFVLENSDWDEVRRLMGGIPRHAVKAAKGSGPALPKRRRLRGSGKRWYERGRP